MGTLYVSTLPVGGLDDWPLRAQRRFPQVSLVVAENLCAAQDALRGLPLTSPMVGMGGAGASLATLVSDDVMLLLDGGRAAPAGPALALIRAAIDRGHRVEALPGPAAPVTALVVSGLPADSFVYLGRLPAEQAARHDLLSSVAADRRTLVVVTVGGESGVWDALYGALGARPAALCAETGAARGLAWRGTLGPAGEVPDVPESPCALVIGGATDRPERWAADRVGAEVRACLGQGMGPGQAAKHLAVPSGWPRREIYRLAVQAGSSPEEELRNDGIR